MIVVDASLAAKWVLSEAHTVAALRFLRTYRNELTAPDILFVEVAGAIVRQANTHKDMAQDMLATLAKWTAVSGEQIVRSRPTTLPQLYRAGRLAIELGHPLKDCVYLALALDLSCDLATCDVKFRDRAGSAYPQIRLLADYA